MLCFKCKKKDAHIAILNKDGSFYESNALCCWCFVKDFKEKILNLLNVKQEDSWKN